MQLPPPEQALQQLRQLSQGITPAGMGLPPEGFGKTTEALSRVCCFSPLALHIDLVSSPSVRLNAVLWHDPSERSHCQAGKTISGNQPMTKADNLSVGRAHATSVAVRCWW